MCVTYMYAYVPCVEARKGKESPTTGVTDGSDPQCRWW